MSKQLSALTADLGYQQLQLIPVIASGFNPQASCFAVDGASICASGRLIAAWRHRHVACPGLQNEHVTRCIQYTPNVNGRTRFRMSSEDLYSIMFQQLPLQWLHAAIRG
jgi:hypothetical protein